MLKYFGYHNAKREVSGGISSRGDAIKLVVEDIKRWWSPGGIQLKHPSTIVYMVECLVNQYLKLQKNKRREGKDKVMRDKYLNKLQNTLWVVCKKTEERLKCSSNPKNIEDWDYLEKVRGTKREATVGSIDTEEVKKNKRKIVRTKQRERKAKKDNNNHPSTHDDIQLSSSSEEETDIHDPEVVFNLENKKKRPIKITKRKQVITPEVCCIAAKKGLTNRLVFEIVGASTSDVPMKDKNLSVNTTRRKIQQFIAKASEKIISNKLSLPSEQYTLHWDGKIFKALTHCGKNQDRVAVLLTASGGEEILLGIIPVQNGTAAEEHRAIINLLNERKIPLNKIAACVFDTTSVNTGELNGIVRKLETSLNHSILELACRHHIYELVCGAVSPVIIGKKTARK